MVIHFPCHSIPSIPISVSISISVSVSVSISISISVNVLLILRLLLSHFLPTPDFFAIFSLSFSFPFFLLFLAVLLTLTIRPCSSFWTPPSLTGIAIASLLLIFWLFSSFRRSLSSTSVTIALAFTVISFWRWFLSSVIIALTVTSLRFSPSTSVTIALAFTVISFWGWFPFWTSVTVIIALAIASLRLSSSASVAVIALALAVTIISSL
mmetsp:Transcript_22132/g.34378  ORF Transcript_22132/g.34378 Transcript_22132/m.34378 type:complete len:210 (+) Transcript_22132:69-698(+)